MKKTLLKITLFLLTLHLGAVTKAGHDDDRGRGSYNLTYASQELSNAVNYSSLRYQVKEAVYRFSSAIASLSRCSYYPGSIDQDKLQLTVLENNSDATIQEHNGYECYEYRRHVQQTWSELDRYLYDTYYDFPNVYRTYVNMKQALRNAGL